MPAPTRSPYFRPPGVPAYYLARPAGWWTTAFRRKSTGDVVQPDAGRGHHEEEPC